MQAEGFHSLFENGALVGYGFDRALEAPSRVTSYPQGDRKPL